MNGVAIGPLVLDASRLAFILAVMAFFIVAEFRGLGAGRQRGERAARWAFPVLIAWIVGARIGFVALNFDSFAARPIDALKLWQGGFSPLSGLALAAVVSGFAALRRGAPFFPLAFGGTVAAAVFLMTASVLTEPAPDLPGGTYQALRGPDVTLDDIDGPVVLNLWATWCPPCRREMPMMLDVAAHSDAATFVFANQGEGVAQIGRFLAAERLPAEHIVLDRRMELMTALGAVGLPATLVFDREGRMVHSHTGEISRAALTRALRRVRAP